MLKWYLIKFCTEDATFDAFHSGVYFDCKIWVCWENWYSYWLLNNDRKLEKLNSEIEAPFGKRFLIKKIKIKKQIKIILAEKYFEINKFHRQTEIYKEIWYLKESLYTIFIWKLVYITSSRSLLQCHVCITFTIDLYHIKLFVIVVSCLHYIHNRLTSHQVVCYCSVMFGLHLQLLIYITSSCLLK